MADGRSWFAVSASGLSGSLHVGSVASATLSGVSVLVNRGTGATGFDWSTLGADTPSGLATVSGDQLDVAGTLASLDIAGLVSGSAGFHVSKKTVSIGVSAALLDISLSNLHLKVGTDAVGLEITSGSIADVECDRG